MDSLTLIRHNSSYDENNRTDTHAFATRPLNFKWEQEVLKFNNIFVSQRSTKTDMGTKFENPSAQSPIQVQNKDRRATFSKQVLLHGIRSFRTATFSTKLILQKR